MLNLELARILTAERRRATAEAVRQGRFRIELAERAAECRAAESCTPAQPEAGAGQGGRPALGTR